ncbi:MAG TPA: phage tail tape measure protein [Chroococcidiopsis sp.]
MSVESLVIEISAINDALGPIREVQSAITALQSSSRGFRELGSQITGVGESMTRNVTLPIVAGLGAAGYAAVEFESQMADLNKAFGFDNGSQQAAAAQDVIMGLSQELGQMPANVTAIATEAGKLGVQFNQLEDYTRTVTAASVAFDVSAQEAGSSMATLTNVLGYQDAQGRVNIAGLQALGDAINYFADSGATSEAAIMSVLQRAGGATRTFGLANDSATALSAAFLNLGYAPEVVGTGLNGMLPQLQNATQQSTKFQEALAQIGLPARDFERMIKQDATGALITFMDAVKQSGDTSIIQRMFGTGSDSAMLTSAIQNLDAFKNTLQDIENIPAGSMMQTFAKRQETTAASLEGLKAATMRMGITLGAVLLPALNNIADALMPVIDGFAAFAEAHPGITQAGVAIALVVAAVGPMLIVVGQVVSAIGTLQAAFAALKAVQVAAALGQAPAALGMLSSILTGAAAAVGAFASAFVGLGAIALGILAGVVAIGAAVTGTTVTFSDFTTTIESAFTNLGANLMQVGPAIGAFAGLIGAQFTQIGTTIQLAFAQGQAAVTGFATNLTVSVGAAVTGTIARIVAGAAQAVGAVRSMGSQMIAAVSAIAGQMFAAGANIVNSIARGIRSAMGAVTSAISSVASTVRGALPFSPPEWGPLSDIMSVGGNIVNSIASGINPAPIASAMSGALTPIGAMMQPGAAGGMAPVGGGAAVPGGGGAAGGSSIVVNVTVNAGGAANAQEIGDSLEERLSELLPRLMAQMDNNAARVAYG